jgi:iron complex outermembrane receptor protein
VHAVIPCNIRADRLGRERWKRQGRNTPHVLGTTVLTLSLLVLAKSGAAQSDSGRVTVTATRVSRPVEDEPTPVEIERGEEIGSKMQAPRLTLTQLLEEVRGTRVELTSAVFGSTSLRIQGLSGHYTAVLTDGLPLLGVQFGGLGLGQVPPLDVQHAEVIKGASTALYGPSALGGVVNLVSRTPADERELVLHQTSQAGTDGLAWFSKRLSDRVGLTVLGGAHRQREQDVNRDGWADVPGVRRVELRPRLFWSTEHGTSIVATVGGVLETRAGGTLAGAVLPNGQSFTTASNTRRADGGFVGVFPLAGTAALSVRASATSQWGRQDYGPATSFSTQHGRHRTVFTEATMTIPRARATWLLGAGFEQDAFHSPGLVGFDYTFGTVSAFAQTTVSLGPRIGMTAGGRCDSHSRYGAFCNPRVAILLRAPGSWRVRLSGATGFFAPTPFVDETEGISLARLAPFTGTIVICNPRLCANDSGAVQTTDHFSIRAERARYGSLDVTGRAGPLGISATVFASTVVHPLLLSDLNIFDERPQLMNAAEPTRTAGVELSGSLAVRPVTVVLNYAYLHSTMVTPGRARREAPLTPRHSGGLEAAWEGGRNTRIAFHGSYTGRQTIFEDPYRTVTLPYTTIGLLFSQRLGRTALYVGGENLGDVRQTRYDPLMLPTFSEEGRWTTDVWAPLAGRVISTGIRVNF